MIHLLNVAKTYRTTRGEKVVLNPTTMSIPTNRRVGVLGQDKSGKSTLINLLTGRVYPNLGRIVTTVRLSPPITHLGLLAPKVTGQDNAVFAANLYQRNPGQLVGFVQALSGLDSDEMEAPVESYSRVMREKLIISINLAIGFDCYLADDKLEVMDRAFRDRFRTVFNDLYRNCGLFLVSGDPALVRSYCELGLVIYDRTLIPFDDIDEAISFFNAL